LGLSKESAGKRTQEANEMDLAGGKGGEIGKKMLFLTTEPRNLLNTKDLTF
jgi:hypothetical protein